jgi:MFS superfamily sulfate permease-like transporter
MTNPIDAAERSNDSNMPQYEPWLGVAASSFIPLVAMFLLPHAFTLPLIAVAVLLLAAGMYMLFRHERGAKQRPNGM